MHVFNLTRQSCIFCNLKEDQRFQIKDDFLFNCIGLGCGTRKSSDRVQGFNSEKAFGYALLSYFASIALGFRRIPFCEDRIYTSYIGKIEQYRAILNELDQDKINAIVGEVREIYAHTQDHLAKLGLDKVNIVRWIKSVDGGNAYAFNNTNSEYGYAETLIMLRKSCDVLGIEEIKVEMDTLNSFGDEGAYIGEVKIELTVPAKDVLYCSALIGDRRGQGTSMETGEWVIINRSPTGVQTIPTKSIIYRQGMFKFEKVVTRNDAKQFLEQYVPFVFRTWYRNVPTYKTNGVRLSLKYWLIKKLLNCK
jgi:hypothetical protein